MIAVFGLPAVAVYLFKNGETMAYDTMFEQSDHVSPDTRMAIFFLLLIAYEVMGLHMLTENIGNPLKTLLDTLFFISFLLLTLYNLVPAKNRFIDSPLLPVLHLIICAIIQYIDDSGDNLYLSLIAGMSAINYSPLPQAKVYGIGAIGVYLAGSTVKIMTSVSSEMSQIVRYLYVNTLVVMLALIAFYTLKKQMVTSNRLAAALHKVKEQTEQLKGMAVIEERNRISAEMHDTVGHTLTAAVLSLEAAEVHVSDQPSLAVQKIHQGKEQVRRGLTELRASVKAIRAGSKTEFGAALRQLLQEIIADTGLDIQSIVDPQISLPAFHAGILLAAIKECATNAIKHGHATHADILIQQDDGRIRLSFTDNGVGTTDVKPGNGLSIMRERINSVGGSLKIESMPEEGFTISLTIPIEQKREDAP